MKQRLSYWIMGAITMACNSKGLQPSVGLACSFQSWYCNILGFQGISVEEICAAASWAMPNTFIRFFKLDITAPTLSHTVLSMGLVLNMPV